jgi:nucleotide-binding universal stress UspA family protein
MAGHPFKRIVAAMSFSEGSDAAMEQAFELARTSRARIDLVHVRETSNRAASTSMGLMPYAETSGLDDAVERELSARAQRAAQIGIVCHSHVLDGWPPSEIVRHAEETRADLIVLGAPKRSGLARAIFRGVAERVIQLSSCPVVVVPPARRPSLHVLGPPHVE